MRCSRSLKDRKEKERTLPSNLEKCKRTNVAKLQKKKSKPKYVPGPIGALIDQAETVGLQLAINQEDELEFKREGRGPIPLTKLGKKVWKKEVKQHINDDLLQELHEAVKPAFDSEGQETPPRKKRHGRIPSENR